MPYFLLAMPDFVYLYNLQHRQGVIIIEYWRIICFITFCQTDMFSEYKKCMLLFTEVDVYSKNHLII
jgi:hypothetical protein